MTSPLMVGNRTMMRSALNAAPSAVSTSNCSTSRRLEPPPSRSRSSHRASAASSAPCTRSTTSVCGLRNRARAASKLALRHLPATITVVRKHATSAKLAAREARGSSTGCDLQPAAGRKGYRGNRRRDGEVGDPAIEPCGDSMEPRDPQGELLGGLNRSRAGRMSRGGGLHASRPGAEVEPAKGLGSSPSGVGAHLGGSAAPGSERLGGVGGPGSGSRGSGVSACSSRPAAQWNSAPALSLARRTAGALRAPPGAPGPK
mmetsp:Transcript_84338/g.239027  ORF Transcript_84338/g.239027 Transcript_84338/m.239027 type:complete len:259 (-) Transcript_84338:6-782(-)